MIVFSVSIFHLNISVDIFLAIVLNLVPECEYNGVQQQGRDVQTGRINQEGGRERLEGVSVPGKRGIVMYSMFLF